MTSRDSVGGARVPGRKHSTLRVRGQGIQSSHCSEWQVQCPHGGHIPGSSGGLPPVYSGSLWAGVRVGRSSGLLAARAAVGGDYGSGPPALFLDSVMGQGEGKVAMSQGPSRRPALLSLPPPALKPSILSPAAHSRPASSSSGYRHPHPPGTYWDVTGEAGKK